MSTVSSGYRFSSALIVRLLRSVLGASGLVLALLVLAVALLSAPPAVLLVGLLLLLAVLAGVAAVRRAEVVRFDETGYRVRLVRGAGVRRARWTEVEDVVATELAGARCVVLRLRDGRSTTLPVDALAGGRDAFVRDLQQHLNRGHGYRPLRRP
ncbi:MAG: hypothetical protein HOQ22_03920 [Nocardioidaceae bacterium]|nr:hypothetical protein [Nocardioidaceae bacterium]NUS50173.1 hypothetical protein [Nocardioidaceae bacterium]